MTRTTATSHNTTAERQVLRHRLFFGMPECGTAIRVVNSGRGASRRISRTRLLTFDGALTSLALLLMLALAGCGSSPTGVTEPPVADSPSIEASPASAPAFRFVDRTAEAGVLFTARNGQESGHLSILETLGSGVALFDFDQDGRLDVLAVGGGEFSDAPQPTGLPNGLFRQISDWHFATSDTPAGIERVPFYAHGAAIADFDNDGFRDALITGYHGIELFRNLGDGTFQTMAAKAGLASDRWSTSAAWGDINGDGSLDLYVASYVNWSFENHPECRFQGVKDVCAPKVFEAESDVLWLSNGDGTFQDVSASAGLQPGGKGLAVIAADLDVDGDIDFYIANDTTPNRYYRNDGTGHFQESGIRSGTALGDGGEADGSMGVDVCDFNQDGLPDLWVTNYENQTFGLYRNDGQGLFQHVSSVTGISSVGRQFVGFGTVAIDFDRDGDEDLLATNGHVMRSTTLAPVQQQPLLFENLGAGQFRNVADSAGPFFQSSHMGRGLAAGDIDRDGDPDAVIAHLNEPLALLENTTPTSSHSIRIRLIGTASTRDAIGAHLLIPNQDGSRQVRLIRSGSSYLSSSDHQILLPIIGSSPIEIIIHWPRGQQSVVMCESDTEVTVHEPARAN